MNVGELERMDDAALIRALHKHRLDEDLTLKDLGERVGLSAQGVLRLFTHTRPRPHERTSNRIRTYLKTVAR